MLRTSLLIFAMAILCIACHKNTAHLIQNETVEIAYDSILSNDDSFIIYTINEEPNTIIDSVLKLRLEELR